MTVTNLLLTLAKYGWCIFLTVMLVRPILKGTYKDDLYVFRQIRPLMVLQNIGVIFFILTIACALLKFCPFLNISWLYLLPGSHGKDGSGAQNIMLMPVRIKYFGLLFLVFFGMNLPRLARYEEWKYRRGTQDWRDGALRSIRFGLAHCWVGVPLFAGLALAFGGLWFTHQYFKGGVERSTLHHTVYNLLVVCVVFVVVLMVGIGGI